MDIHTVDPIFVDPKCRTGVWISEQADEALTKMAKLHGKEIGKLLDKIAYWAEAGFEKHEGATGSGQPIIHEWRGVYRLGYRTLHRVIGFYEDESKKSYVCMDAFLKKKQTLSSKERGYIDAVADIKEHDLWRRRQDEHS